MFALPRRPLLLFVDAALLAIGWVLAYSIRFDFAVPSSYEASDYATQLKMLLLPVVGAHIALFWLFQLYRGMLRYVGITELRQLGLACGAHTLLLLAFNAFIDGRDGFAGLPLMADANDGVMRVPYSVIGFYAMFGVLATGGLRMSRRIFSEGRRQREAEGMPRALIAGAGDLAHQLIANVQRDPNPSFIPVSIVTADPKRLGLRIGGVPVDESLENLAQHIADKKIDLVLVAFDDPSAERLRKVVAACEQAKATFHIVPSVQDIVGGRVEVGKLRRIEIEDLLGREPHELSLPADRNYLRGERVLVTGAGGSIGSELCRQIAAYEPAELLLLGKGENSLFEISEELRRRFPKLPAEPIVGDIRDADRMRQLFTERRPTIVFHAAAHKHVPLMERQPEEAVRNNIIGTATLALLAHEHGVKRFLLISTDKAVRPTSVMGATKRIAEMIVFSMAERSPTLFQAVRFGNVLGSRGSVIPVFRRQIETGGPITLTHPDVTRYFMTIPEAAHLVLQAGANDTNRSLFLLDMGEPVRIADLARNMIALSGLRPGIDIKIEYIGLRPGEKLREELLTESEGATKTGIGKLFVTAPRHVPEWHRLLPAIERFDELAHRADRDGIRSELRRLIPDYHPTGEQPRTDVDAIAAAAGVDVQALRADDSEAETPVVPVEQSDLFDAGAPPTTASDASIQDALETSGETVSATLAPPQVLDDSALFAAMEGGEAEAPPRPPVLLMMQTTDHPPELVAEALAQLRRHLLDGDVLFVTGHSDAPPVPLPEGVFWRSSDKLRGGALFAQALRMAPRAFAAGLLSPRVRLLPNALERLCGALDGRKDAVAVYSDYERVRADGAREPVALLNHEGCFHERFDFGGLLLLHVPAVDHVGGVDENLHYAWEYDLHLRLMEKGLMLRFPLSTYELIDPPAAPGTAAKLHSPAPGPLGGFSYIFYPPEVEAEVTQVFETALRRRGAWLETPYATVPYPDREYDVRCSVVIPVLNREKYIGNAIQKVRSGTLQDFEIVVVDNGSTDGTRDVVEAIAAIDDRVRLLRGTGGSIASALNEGIRAARGKFICQLDSDDEYAPQTLEKMVDALEGDLTGGVAVSYYRLMDEAGRPIEDVAPITHKGFTRNQILRRDGAGALRVFPKCVLEENGLYDEEHYGNFGEDYDMILKTVEKYRLLRVHEVLYFYRRHDDNTDVTRDPQMKFRNKNRARHESIRRRREILARLDAEAMP